MFWGLIMEPNKRYAQTVDQSFHVSMASLDVNTADDNFVQVMFFHNNKHFLLCTLNKKTTCQVPLDLNFQENTEIVFTCNGKGHVHLTGYMIPEQEDPFDEDLDEEELDSEENSFSQIENHVKKIKNEPESSSNSLSRKRKAEGAADEDSSDSDSDDFDMEDDNESLEDEEESDESEGNEGESDEEESEEEEQIPEPVKQQLSKKAKKQLQQSQVAHVNGNDSKQAKKQLNNTNEVKKDKSQQNANKSQSEQQQQQQQKKRTIEGGVSIEDLKVGNGQPAKPGKHVSLYYVGKLTNGKKFDSTTNGDGFKFRLGKGEVIRGWDVGVAGMKVGGKRRLTIPAAMGYGKKGSPPVIPPNSTLVFDVELKNIS